MSTAARYTTVADGFGDRVGAVAVGAWDAPAPCEGWVARDVVRHLVEWVPGFFQHFAGVTLAAGPSVDDDPAGAWRALDESLRALLADPDVAAREIDVHGQQLTVDAAVVQFVLGDVLVHTWDLARATGLDERLDPDEVHALFGGMAEADEAMRQSGHYGPKVEVAPDADEQTRLLAFSGRAAARPG